MAITMGARAAPMGSARRAALDMRERARAFRLARRHSLLVMMLRVMLPIGALSLTPVSYTHLTLPTKRIV